MKKLTILHTESSCGWGGQEIRILTEARGMVQRGHRVILMADPKSRIYQLAADYLLEPVGLPIEKKRLTGLLSVRRWLARHGADIDVINTHSSTDAWLVAVACATLRNMPPVVRSRHVSTAINNAASTRWLYQRATRHIVTTGEKLRQQLHRENGYPLSGMTSIRTGIDLGRYCPRDKTAERKALGIADRSTLGIVATLRSWKGHSQLLEAWAQLRAEFGHWQLLIVGDGPQRANLEAQCRTLGLVDSVRFVGNQDNAERWLACMDLFTLPSYGNEGVPQGIMQAMACGVPVVSTTVGAINEAVQDGETGYMIAPQDSAMLATTLGRLMRDDALRQKMAVASLAWAQQQFGLDVMLDRMEAVFLDAIRGGRQ